MTKVTTRRRVTIPREIADLCGIEPGDEVRWVPAGDSVLLVFPGRRAHSGSVEKRLEIFDCATERQLRRQQGRVPGAAPRDRGWRRDDLYDRGRAR